MYEKTAIVLYYHSTLQFSNFIRLVPKYDYSDAFIYVRIYIYIYSLRVHKAVDNPSQEESI